MQIKVRFFTSLREIVGKREETLIFADGEKVDINKVLQMLSDHFGKPFIEYVFEAKTRQPKAFLQFLINGNSATIQNGLQTMLKDCDVLAILPPVGGG